MKSKEVKSYSVAISQNDVPLGRRGKHHVVVGQLLMDLADLKDGEALKIRLSELPDSKANIRSSLSRAAKLKNLEIATSSDDEFLYVWKP